MTTSLIKINRAPVLTLWAAIVAERLGYNHGEALSLGKAVAGLNAQAKGKRLGIFHPQGIGGEGQAKAGRSVSHQNLWPGHTSYPDRWARRCELLSTIT
jgi:hypothetical protein